MINSILKDTKIVPILNNTVAGTGDTLNGSIVDLQGYDSVCFIAKTGDVAATAVGTLKAYSGDVSNLSDGAYKTVTASFTASATDSDNKLVVLDVVRPGKRYVRADFVRATANIPVESIIAILYNGKNFPKTQSDIIASGMCVC